MPPSDEVEPPLSAPTGPPFALLLRAGAATSAGRVRSQNQDRYLIVDQRLFLVADGMGGHVGGEVAAQVTVDTLSTLSAAPNELLRSADVVARVEEANLKILQRADDDAELRGMGTTLTGIAVVEGDATSPALLLLVNVGDSRTYWLRGGELEQLSEDHSVVGELQRDGKLSASEARTHKSRSVLTRALGVEPGVDCDVLEVVPIAGDRFLICSDGLPTELVDASIASTLRRLADPSEAAAALVRDAVDHGGRDNVTVIVVDVVEGIDGSGVLPTSARTSASTGNTVSTAQSDSVRSAANSNATNQPPEGRGPRRPWIVNLRVLIFLAAVAVVGLVVVWALRNAPAGNPTPTDPTAIRIDTKMSGDAPGSQAPVTTAASDIADPVPGAVVDPFATTSTKPATSTTAKATGTTTKSTS